MPDDEMMTPSEHGSSAAAAGKSREVAHNDQLEVWAEELTFALMDWLKDPETYDDKVHMASAMKAEIKSIVETAFDLAERSRLQPAAAAEGASPEGVDILQREVSGLADENARLRSELTALRKEGEGAVAPIGYQWKHGNFWSNEEYYNGQRSTVSRAIYAHPSPAVVGEGGHDPTAQIVMNAVIENCDFATISAVKEAANKKRLELLSASPSIDTPTPSEDIP